MALAMALWCLLQLNATEAQGTWEQLLDNPGIPSMHTTITHYNTTIIYYNTARSEEGLHGAPCNI
jgi:hypothetical protein